MHSQDPNKDNDAFGREIDAIMTLASAYAHLKDTFDFRGFVFPAAGFTGTRFIQKADFAWATFAESADFVWARFVHRANFTGAKFGWNADFSLAVFGENADFGKARFAQKAHFAWARFLRNADFSFAMFVQEAGFSDVTFTETLDLSYASFGQRETIRTPETSAMPPAVADFTGARFEKPPKVVFFRVNQPLPRPRSELTPRLGNAGHPLRARFLGCDVEGVRFTDVNWHEASGRLMLQDEIDVREGNHRNYALVAEAYRQLVNNFQKVRAYELAEDCVIGAMEMRRLNPQAPLLERLIINCYWLLSNYGSSYRRALEVLGALFLACALLFPALGLRATKDSGIVAVCPGAAPGSSEATIVSWRCALAHPHWAGQLWGTFKAGLRLSAEVATFQKDRLLVPASGWGHNLLIVETVAIPAQLALLLLALRRRFRL